MAEWSKAHAWKVCIPQKGIQGSNPCLSAKQNPPNRPLKAAQESAKPVETSLLDRERAFALSVSGPYGSQKRLGGFCFSTPRRRRKGSALCANKARSVPEWNAMHPPPQAEGIGWGQAMACPYTASRGNHLRILSKESIKGTGHGLSVHGIQRKSSSDSFEGIHQGDRPWPVHTRQPEEIIFGFFRRNSSRGQAMACPYTASRENHLRILSKKSIKGTGHGLSVHGIQRKSSSDSFEGIHQGDRPWPVPTGHSRKIRPVITR